MKTLSYKELFDKISNKEDISNYYGYDIVDEENKVLFVLKEKKNGFESLFSNATIEVVDATGNGISSEDLDYIKEKIANALEDVEIEELMFNSDVPKS